MGQARRSPAPGAVPRAPATASGSATLVAATVAALVLGGWWWVANAPPSPAGPVAAPAPSSPTADPAMDQAGARADYPDPAEIIRFDESQVEELLPERDEVIRRDVGVLTDRGVIDYSGVVPGEARFLLEYTCLGEGELEIEVVNPEGSTNRRRLACDGTLESFEFAAGSPGYAQLRLVADTTDFVGVGVQLVPR
jgi:hypothetical protein